MRQPGVAVWIDQLSRSSGNRRVEKENVSPPNMELRATIASQDTRRCRRGRRSRRPL